MIGARRFRRDRSGAYRLALSEPERALLRALPDQAKDLVGEGEPLARRLFPPAYPTDEEADADYRRSAGASLLDRHRRALDAVMESVDAVDVDEATAHEWLDALEVLRLVVGTHLDISEDMDFGEVDEDDPRLPHLVVYQYLSELQADVIDALAAGLPARGTGAEPPDVAESALEALGPLAPPDGLDGLEGWLGQ